MLKICKKYLIKTFALLIINFRKFKNSNEFFKQAGFYCKDPSQVRELAQRMDYEQGQKLIKLLVEQLDINLTIL